MVTSHTATDFSDSIRTAQTHFSFPGVGYLVLSSIICGDARSPHINCTLFIMHCVRDFDILSSRLIRVHFLLLVPHAHSPLYTQAIHEWINKKKASRPCVSHLTSRDPKQRVVAMLFFSCSPQEKLLLEQLLVEAQVSCLFFARTMVFTCMRRVCALLFAWKLKWRISEYKVEKMVCVWMRTSTRTTSTSTHSSNK